MKSINKIAFCVNTEKPGAQELCKELQALAKQLGVQSTFCKKYPITVDCLNDHDACCVIGGDGTMLSAVNASVKNQVPIFGINLGKLGFLATIPLKSAKENFVSMLKGEFTLAKRFILECSTIDGRKAIALNDVVVKHYAPSRLMELNVLCNGQFVNAYASDGIIISTPTGSTAYNLSAGGPIIVPGANVFAMTPICPHTLTNRSVIFDNKSILTIDTPYTSGHLEKQAHVSLDGQVPWNPKDIFPLTIKIAKETFSLLQPKDYSHFNILSQKLRWEGSSRTK